MDVCEEDLVHPVHRLDSDWLALQCVPYRDQSAFPPNATTSRDSAHVEAGRILNGREPTWKLSERRRVLGRRRLVLNGLVASLVIELRSKGVELGLLRANGVCRRT
jgi:hypothetical protein